MTWPTPPTDYTTTPWADPLGILWIYNETKERWSHYSVQATFVQETEPTGSAKGQSWFVESTGALKFWNGVDEWVAVAGGISLTSYATQVATLSDYPAELSSAQAAGTASIRAIGTTATDAMAGNTSLAFLPLAGGTMTGATVLDPLATIQLEDSFSADERWTGVTIPGLTAVALTLGQLCYIGSGGWSPADANAVGTSGSVALGICLVAADADEQTMMLLYGTFRSASLSASLTVGAPLYASAATAGAIALIAPSGTGDIVRVVGHVLTAEPNTILFNPSQNWIELA